MLIWQCTHAIRVVISTTLAWWCEWRWKQSCFLIFLVFLVFVDILPQHPHRSTMISQWHDNDHSSLRSDWAIAFRPTTARQRRVSQCLLDSQLGSLFKLFRCKSVVLWFGLAVVLINRLVMFCVCSCVQLQRDRVFVFGNIPCDNNDNKNNRCSPHNDH